MLHGFPKVGSREQVSLKDKEYREQTFRIYILRAKVWPKTRLKMHFFLKIKNGEGTCEQCIDGNLVG